MKKIMMLLIAALTISSVTVFAQEKAGKKDTTQNTVLYTCPMHPDVKMDKAGKCPKCGMELSLSKKEEMKSAVTKNYTCPVHADVILSLIHISEPTRLLSISYAVFCLK